MSKILQGMVSMGISIREFKQTMQEFSAQLHRLNMIFPHQIPLRYPHPGKSCPTCGGWHFPYLLNRKKGFNSILSPRKTTSSDVLEGNARNVGR